MVKVEPMLFGFPNCPSLQKNFKRASVGKEIVLLFVFSRSFITNLGGDVDAVWLLELRNWRKEIMGWKINGM